MHNKKIELKVVEISKIFILNPRERNELIRKEIQENIENVGLKRPITICYKTEPKNGYKYDLVCGQGRLEAYIANNQKKIPAIIIDASEEEALIMSLVENIARKTYQPYQLLQAVKVLKNQGYSNSTIAKKVGLSQHYITEISHLLDKGEDKLLNDVEKQKVPLKAAIKISYTSSQAHQSILQELYDKYNFRGSKLNYIRNYLEIRKKGGGKKVLQFNLSAKDLYNKYEKEVAESNTLARKAEKLENTLIIITQCFKNLFKDDNFNNLLKAENLLNTPEYIATRVKT